MYRKRRGGTMTQTPSSIPNSGVALRSGSRSARGTCTVPNELLFPTATEWYPPPLCLPPLPLDSVRMGQRLWVYKVVNVNWRLGARTLLEEVVVDLPAIGDVSLVRSSSRTRRYRVSLLCGWSASWFMGTFFERVHLDMEKHLIFVKYFI